VLNSDFDLSAEMLGGAHLTNGARLRAMLRVLFERPTPQIIENKLLCAALLSKQGIPVPRILHGAFYEAALRTFPLYSPDMLRMRLRHLVQRSDFDWVLKPATGALGHGVLAMSARKWRRDRWSVDKLVEHVDGWFQIPPIKFFEHRGVLLQRRFALGGASRGESEFKVHVLFGRPVDAEAWAQPSQYSMLYLRNPRFVAGGRFECFPADDPLCPVLSRSVFVTHWAAIEHIARRVAALFGLPWFRLDLFIGGHGGSQPLVNEITFPSHALVSWPVLTRLRAAWQPRSGGGLRYRVKDSGRFTRDLLASIGCAEAEFLTPERCKQGADGMRQCAEWDMRAWRSWVSGHVNETIARYRLSDANEAAAQAASAAAASPSAQEKTSMS
jgi:hypothetical protein